MAAEPFDVNYDGNTVHLPREVLGVTKPTVGKLASSLKLLAKLFAAKV